MEKTELSTPRKGAGERLREFYELNRGKVKPSEKLLEILKRQKIKKQKTSTKN